MFLVHTKSLLLDDSQLHIPKLVNYRNERVNEVAWLVYYMIIEIHD